MKLITVGYDREFNCLGQLPLPISVHETEKPYARPGFQLFD
jgi:hypothetical protein